MRALLLSFLLPALLWLGAGVVVPATPARAETLDDFAVALGELNARVRMWLRLADRLPQQDTIDRYKAQTKEEDFKKKDPKPVEAKDLIAIVLTAKLELYEVRKAAAEALKDAAQKDYDPDLKPRKGSGTSKRGQLALENLIPYFKDKKSDLVGRSLVQDILQAWFGQGKGKNQSAIVNFKADDEKTWGPAGAAWREVARES